MSDDPNPKIVVIVGPTASGKSALALELAKKFDGEIICADSRTVYKGMSIGTAKPTNEEMMQIKHHLLDVVTPETRFTAADFKELALQAIDDINQRRKLPIMAGGTGLYIDSVIYDYRFPGAGNQELRVKHQALGLDDLVEKLKELDFEAAGEIDLKNPRRVERAIETVGWPKSKSQKLRRNTLVLGLTLDKNVIQQRIQKRIEKMLEQGLMEELQKVGQEFGWENEALRAPAYLAFKEVVLGGKTTAEGTLEFARRDVNLAKRQMTWFKRNLDIVWLDASDPSVIQREAEKMVAEFLTT